MNQSIRRSALAVLLLIAAPLGAVHCATKTILVENVTVGASEEWSESTILELTPGTAFTVEVDPEVTWSSGRWTGNADGDTPQGGDYALPGAAAYSLIGRIGDGAPFSVGTRYEGVADAKGTLTFAMNDVPGVYFDNRGRLPVRITLSDN